MPVLQGFADVVTVTPAKEPLPSELDWYAIVAMGGPMGVNDQQHLPWVSDEISFIVAAIERGVPFWGVCLGAQLLASALGAAVFACTRPEVGVGLVTLTADGAADPVFGGLSASFEALHWHSDTFDLPSDAVLLAGSTQTAHQVFRRGLSYGIQCHLEVSSELAAGWLAINEYRSSLHTALGRAGDKVLAAGLGLAEIAMRDHATLLMTRWLNFVCDETRLSDVDGVLK